MFKYAVRFEKHVSGSVMTYSQHNSFHEAAESLRHLKSINTIDYCYIDEIWFQSGLSKDETKAKEVCLAMLANLDMYS